MNLNSKSAKLTMDFSLLEHYNIPVLPYKIVHSKDEACKAAKEITYPVAIKLISEKILHKTEFHALSLNLREEHSLVQEYERLEKIVQKKDVQGILVQKFMHPRFELIAGGKTDSQFGPTIMIGFGGIYTEILQDAAIRVCPPSETDVRSMIAQLKSFPILKGARGCKGINLSKLQKILRSVSNLMINEMPKELDINPLFCTDDEIYAADVRVLR